MKKILLLFIVYNSIALTIKAQFYSPLIENNKYWDVLYLCGFETNPICGYCSEVRYFLNGDTLIHGKTYKKIYFYDFIRDSSVAQPYFCPLNLVDTVPYLTNSFIREDTVTKKVYYYDNNIFTAYSTCIIDSEVVLYDFNVQTGDSLNCIMSIGDYGSVVDSVRYELIYGMNRKVIYFYINGAGHYTMTEGIGGSWAGGGLYQCILQGIGFGYTLECVMKYDTLGSLLYGSGCADFITNVQNHNSTVNELSIYPNPTNGRVSFNIVFNEVITVYNIFGETVQIIKPQKYIKDIDLTILPNGIYYIKLANKVLKVVKI